MNVAIYIIFCLFYYLTIINGQFFGPDPVRFHVKNITNCDENSKWTWNLDIGSINDTHVYATANGTLDRNFDNSISVLFEFYQFNAKNEWKRVIKVAKKQACGFLRTISGDLFVDIAKKIGVKDPKCPIPKSFYQLDKTIIDVQSTIFGKFLIGKFRCLVQGFSAQKETLFCGRGVFTTTKINI